MPKQSTIAQAKYDKTHIRRYNLKLSMTYDADIIAALDAAPSMQGLFKTAVREYIKSHPVNQYGKTQNVSGPSEQNDE